MVFFFLGILNGWASSIQWWKVCLTWMSGQSVSGFAAQKLNAQSASSDCLSFLIFLRSFIIIFKELCQIRLRKYLRWRTSVSNSTSHYFGMANRRMKVQLIFLWKNGFCRVIPSWLRGSVLEGSCRNLSFRIFCLVALDWAKRFSVEFLRSKSALINNSRNWNQCWRRSSRHLSTHT